MRIAGTVILYNPPNNISNNIETYLQDLEFLLIYDNSSNNDAAKYFQNNDKFYYVWDGENKGIAFRLNNAIEICEDKNIDFLLTMDQDSSFSGTTIYDYIEKIKSSQDQDIGMFGVVHDKRKNTKDAELNKILITSGSVINIDIANKVGLFDEKLFIDGVDTEYCLKLFKNAYKTILFNDIFLNHSLGESSLAITPLLRKEYRAIHNSKRIYYMIRNTLYLRNLYRNEIRFLSWQPIFNEIKNAVFYGREKKATIAAIAKAYIDFRQNKMGK
ncbi:MAG: glycosyltransferase [Bacteroidetes bacterium]|nr:glycosyltransferase [Bacteroidota bacterium]